MSVLPSPAVRPSGARPRRPVRFALLLAGAAVLLAATAAALAPSQDPPAQRGGQVPMRPGGKRGQMGPTQSRTQMLQELWAIQSSAKLKGATGDAISRPDYSTLDWIPANVPGTVLANLMQANAAPDIYADHNIEKVNPADFDVSWWYRCSFVLEAAPNVKSVRLYFEGINYRANVWLNGKQVGSADQIFGAFRQPQIDITAFATPGQRNILAVEVFGPKKGDPTIGFVDWNPAPPDKDMGIWRPVRVESSGAVSVENPFVRSKLNLDTLLDAALTAGVELHNQTAEKVAGTLEGQLENATFSQPVELGPHEVRTVTFAPESYPALRIAKPRVWWTHDLGNPELYVMTFRFRTADKLVSDLTPVRFGIREISDYKTPEGYRGFKLNGKPVLIRAGAWTDDLELDASLRKIRAEVLYAQHMGLNAIRLEGFWGTSSALYDLCDENGILMMVGWSCQWEWENYFGKPVDERYGGILSPQDMDLVSASWRDMVLWLRPHPSIFVWMMGSDLIPTPEMEKRYTATLNELDPGRPWLISAGDRFPSEISGRSGVKMNGPYEWVPPDYWYLDTKNGGAFGFATEIGPGPEVPPIDSINKMMPVDARWPIGPEWSFRSGRGEFDNVKRYTEAMTARLGAPKDLADYCTKAQFLNYEGVRAMFEAYTARKGTATGVVMWMMNAAWPKLWWQLFDYYLQPNGAFYGAKIACEPVHLIYDYGRRSVVAVNNTNKPEKLLKVRARLFTTDLKPVFDRATDLTLEPGEVKTLFSLTDAERPAPFGYLDLRLSVDKEKTPLGTNFYVVPAQDDVLDEAASNWYVTPVKTYADMTALQNLPRVDLKSKAGFGTQGMMSRATVDVENPSKNLAFMVELAVVGNLSGDVVLPVYWEDNYFTLLPGERRRIQALYLQDDLRGEEPELRVRGWNTR